MSSCIVYMTAANEDEALRIGRTLVAERLAACINVLGTITSVYEWNGAVEEATETAFIAKTDANRLESLTERVRELHSYDVPCVVALPISGGNGDFLNWITSQVGDFPKI